MGLANSVTNSNGTLTISTTTGAVIGSLNLAHANTWTASQAFNAGIISTTPSDLTQALNITQTPIGTGLANNNTFYNSITINDNATIMGGFFGVGQNIGLNFGGSSTQGGREAFQATAALVTTTSASSGNRNYVGIQGVGTSIANDNGTSPASA